MSDAESPLLPHGGYRKLRSYKVAEAVYDTTVVFCRRFIAHDRRTSFWGCSSYPARAKKRKNHTHENKDHKQLLESPRVSQQ